MMKEIEKNFKNVMKRIEAAAIRSGRNPGDVKLVTVTKTIDCERIEEAIKAGAYALGENRVQEAVEKYGAVKGGWLAVRRLLRCHPFHRQKSVEYDPVP